MKAEEDTFEDKLQETYQKVSKPYVQFSKKIIGMLICNLFFIEVFAAVMAWRCADTTLTGILVTSVAVECLGGVIWYMKNSEAEKKARVGASIERMKLLSKEVLDKITLSAVEDISEETLDNLYDVTTDDDLEYLDINSGDTNNSQG